MTYNSDRDFFDLCICRVRHDKIFVNWEMGRMCDISSLLGGNKENHQEPQLYYPVSRPRFESGILWMLVCTPRCYLIA